MGVFFSILAFVSCAYSTPKGTLLKACTKIEFDVRFLSCFHSFALRNHARFGSSLQLEQTRSPLFKKDIITADDDNDVFGNLVGGGRFGKVAI